ncbi:hypothetical protein [Paenarthrobacter histidinolovorans]|uniref:hypothetical protein n=1 Tax=Paenarthrobacter histidinolovorans TaxID=43664 RepID=UPI001666DFEF|nr:hypothetical protein [Paenarthrobacter histidinolovorans]GGJ22931.1 hypothetical protein GCM10010052_20010 [Paenarthrobacter histidinolovorans]
MRLEDVWARLDEETKNWILHNYGCAIIPAALAARIIEQAEEPVDLDRHGQLILTREDRDFVRHKAEAAGTITAREAQGGSLGPDRSST